MIKAYKYNTKIIDVLADYDSKYHSFIINNYGQGCDGHGLNPNELVFVIEIENRNIKAYWKHIPNSKTRKEFLQ